MKYLLDTNVLVHLLRIRTAATIIERLERLQDNDVLVCSIVRMELVAGALRSLRVPENLKAVHELLGNFDSLPFDDRAADCAGQLRADLEKLGTPMGPNDLLIASIALVHGLTVVTRNIAEFARVPRLQTEVW